MRRMSRHAGWKEIDRLFEAGTLVGLTDRQLLEQYLGGEAAEASFEALVERHGPMVRAVCRSMIGHRDEADDAFQATFLVLARRAGSIRRRDAVGSWLYGVACRVAARARADAARRGVLQRFLLERARLESTGCNPRASPCPSCWKRSSGCPSAIRAPLVLCYLEGRSHDQAARILGCPMRTIETRLQRGKAKLRTRLVRRGLAPAAGLLAIGVEAPAGSIPAALTESTARASLQFAAARAAGLASTAVGLAQGVMRTLFWDRLGRAAGRMFALSLGLALTIAAIVTAAQKPDQSGPTIGGRIVDENGLPIPRRRSVAAGRRRRS